MKRDLAIFIGIVLLIALVFFIADSFYRIGWNDGYTYRIQEEIRTTDQRVN